MDRAALANAVERFIPGALRLVDPRLTEYERLVLLGMYKAENFPVWFVEPRTRSGAIQWLSRLGDLYADRGENVPATEIFEVVCALLGEIPQRSRREEALFAESLHRLAGMLRDYRLPDAIDVARQALSHARDLYTTAPAQHGRFLCLVLGQLGRIYADADQLREAVQTTSEAVTLLRQYARESDQEAAVRLAAELGQLGQLLARQRRYSDASGAFQESMTIFREMRPERRELLAQFAQTLHYTSSFLHGQGTDEEALPAAQENVEMCRVLLQNPGIDPNSTSTMLDLDLLRRSGNLAAALNLYGEILSSLGRTGEAVEAFDEAQSLRPQ